VSRALALIAEGALDGHENNVETLATRLGVGERQLRRLFLQHLGASASQFVPITIGTGNLQPLQQLGLAIADVARKFSPSPLVIASSDMNHYESDARTRVKDRKAIDQILAMDPEGLYDVVHRENISMCGYGPTVSMLTAAKQLGASRAELVKYATSGDVSLDFDHVVGYAGITVV